MKTDTILTVVIQSANQAMVDYPRSECSKLLHQLADNISAGAADQTTGLLMDSNGNRVGHYYYSPAEDEDES